MELLTKDLYTIFKLKKKTTFKDFFQLFNNKINQYNDQNVIVDLTNFDLSLDEIVKFKTIFEKKIALGTSFVVINSKVNLNEIPEEFIVVPTFQEAVDMIEMDEMTKSLDF